MNEQQLYRELFVEGVAELSDMLQDRLDALQDKYDDRACNEPEYPSQIDRWEEALERLQDQIDAVEDAIDTVSEWLDIDADDDEVDVTPDDIFGLHRDLDSINTRYRGLTNHLKLIRKLAYRLDHSGWVDQDDAQTTEN